ncbi:MAG: hypothetical protein HWE34_02030 [Methylocystaceae bacterium]|nr:hypothetical protein [Methylocystaceae bacterium]
MDHLTEFTRRGGSETLVLYLFGWVDGQGNGGDYGLNVGPVKKTFTTLITTTYMFQPEPEFTLQCRSFVMSAAQFDYLQDHDLDTQDFLSTLGPLPAIVYELDLSSYRDAQAALEAMEVLVQD